MGLARDAASEFAGVMTKLAIDLGSFNDQPTADVIRDLQSALVGNTETVRKYGIIINETRLKQEALNLGIGNGKAPLTAQAKALVTVNLLLKDSKDALGDFSRTQDSFANQTKIVNAQLENLKANIGRALLIPASLALKAFSALFDFLGPKIKELVDKFVKIDEDIGFDNLGKSMIKNWKLILGEMLAITSDTGTIIASNLKRSLLGIFGGESGTLEESIQAIATASEERVNKILSKIKADALTIKLKVDTGGGSGKAEDLIDPKSTQKLIQSLIAGLEGGGVIGGGGGTGRRLKGAALALLELNLMARFEKLQEFSQMRIDLETSTEEKIAALKAQIVQVELDDFTDKMQKKNDLVNAFADLTITSFEFIGQASFTLFDGLGENARKNFGNALATLQVLSNAMSAIRQQQAIIAANQEAIRLGKSVGALASLIPGLGIATAIAGAGASLLGLFGGDDDAQTGADQAAQARQARRFGQTTRQTPMNVTISPTTTIRGDTIIISDDPVSVSEVINGLGIEQIKQAIENGEIDLPSVGA